MEEIRQKLRHRFQAETDIEIESGFKDWSTYAEWLEVLAVQEINKGLVKENEMMREKMRKAMDLLAQGISGIYTKAI
ncbi:MAG: hypothetical protein WC539_07435 [Nitrospirota bacterium]